MQVNMLTRPEFSMIFWSSFTPSISGEEVRQHEEAGELKAIWRKDGREFVVIHPHGLPDWVLMVNCSFRDAEWLTGEADKLEMPEDSSEIIENWRYQRRWFRVPS